MVIAGFGTGKIQPGSGSGMLRYQRYLMDKGRAVSMWSRCCWDYCGEMSLQPLHGQLVPEASLSLELMGAFSSKDLTGPGRRGMLGEGS